MRTGDGNLKRTLDERLSFYVRKVISDIPVEFDEIAEIREDGFYHEIAVQKFGGIAKRSDRDDVDAGNDARLLGVFFGNKNGGFTYPPHLQNHRQNPTHAAHLTGKRKLAHESVVAEIYRLQTTRRG